jgi:hypothetical protein
VRTVWFGTGETRLCSLVSKDRSYKPMVKSSGAQRESDGVVVPQIAVSNAAGGKGPDFGHASGGGKHGGMAGAARSNNPGGQSRPVDAEARLRPRLVKVRELQRKLWAAAKQSEGRRFHALYDRIYRGDVGVEAWERVRANRGAAGVDRITVHANTISDTVVAQHGGDADGMRFYGSGHRILDNTIFDISAHGYGSPPHPDCFQTLDNSKPPTFDVVISGNTCRNVDAQCLIATGDQDGNSGAPSGVPSITFVGNRCANNGAQAVNVRRWPNVVVDQNTFSGPNLTRAVLISESSTGCIVVGNTTTGNRPTVQVDGSSRPGSHVDDNRPA